MTTLSYRLSLGLDPRVVKAKEKLANRIGISKVDVIRMALNEFIRENKGVRVRPATSVVETPNSNECVHDIK
jgi:hypothetical protein